MGQKAWLHGCGDGKRKQGSLQDARGKVVRVVQPMLMTAIYGCLRYGTKEILIHGSNSVSAGPRDSEYLPKSSAKDSTMTRCMPDVQQLARF